MSSHRTARVKLRLKHTKHWEMLMLLEEHGYTFETWWEKYHPTWRNESAPIAKNEGVWA